MNKCTPWKLTARRAVIVSYSPHDEAETPQAEDKTLASTWDGVNAAVDDHSARLDPVALDEVGFADTHH